jgi:hypothetical protein
MTSAAKIVFNTTFANVETSKIYMKQVGDIAKQLSRMRVDAAKTFGTTLRLKGGGVSLLNYINLWPPLQNTQIMQINDLLIIMPTS